MTLHPESHYQQSNIKTFFYLIESSLPLQIIY